MVIRAILLAGLCVQQETSPFLSAALGPQPVAIIPLLIVIRRVQYIAGGRSTTQHESTVIATCCAPNYVRDALRALVTRAERVVPATM